ncbi:SCO2400 family protein [Streptomyces cyaneofuscatus]|uniref:SCO2400 family protein n=1 Tax=Streptomyces cyaneofuscatus TaxID=66883 RepID=UPI00362D90BB
MDYCHPCRRHLNGALACAGCGTPAEALGPFAVPAPTLAGHAQDAPADVAAPAPAARSRRRARGSHRRRGRTVLLAVGGLVLAAGALSLAELAMEPGRDDTAADFVEDAPRGPDDPAVPDSVSGEPPQDPGPVTTGRGRPVDPSPSGSASAADPAESPAPDATAAPTASKDPEPDEATTTPASPPDASDSPPADPSGPVEPEDPQEPPTVPAPPPPPGDPTEDPAPTPSPTPSPTCTRFLWWCT